MCVGPSILYSCEIFVLGSFNFNVRRGAGGIRVRVSAYTFRLYVYRGPSVHMSLMHTVVYISTTSALKGGAS